MTHYVVLRGPRTAFPGKEKISISRVPDGLSHTLGVVEFAGEPVNWMRPDDITPEQFLSQFEGGTVGLHEGGVNVVLLDGTVRFLPFTATRKVVSGLITRNGNEPIDIDF